MKRGIVDYTPDEMLDVACQSLAEIHCLQPSAVKQWANRYITHHIDLTRFLDPTSMLLIYVLNDFPPTKEL